MTSYDDHHLTPLIATAVERLGWSADDPALRETTPTAARGHNLVVVAPPSPAYAVPALAGMLSRLGPGVRGLLLCSEAQLNEWGLLVTSIGGDALRIQVARGTARAMRRLKAADVDLVVTSPDTALALHRRSALGPEDVGAVFLAWPESWESGESLPPLMQDLSKDAQRIICTGAADGAADLVERYARRALTVGTSPAVRSCRRRSAAGRSNAITTAALGASPVTTFTDGSPRGSTRAMSPWRERSAVQTATEAGSMISTTSASDWARRSHETPAVRTGPAGAGDAASAGGTPTVSARRA